MKKVHEHKEKIAFSATVVDLSGTEHTESVSRVETFWTVECLECGMQIVWPQMNELKKYWSLENALEGWRQLPTCSCDEQSKGGPNESIE